MAAFFSIDRTYRVEPTSPSMTGDLELMPSAALGAVVRAVDGAIGTRCALDRSGAMSG